MCYAEPQRRLSSSSAGKWHWRHCISGKEGSKEKKTKEREENGFIYSLYLSKQRGTVTARRPRELLSISFVIHVTAFVGR